ncbi:DUF4129 domain-containing protein [Planococcus sp. N064]|uniref:DUF4129 domain-containing protein n=1 Tax=Planococcus liqunii TaxID=3058394 RepID=A0ABT8MMK6_9BACL|nr:DUF4129 domain-containing protein [Planococcus sp. N064]MDN7226122.1 DUF4129 domain-containing protein [Planococcus sp. N064]
MISRLWSAGNYMLDAFAISLLLVFLKNETAVPLMWLWLLLSFGAAALAFTLFLKFSYHVMGAALVAAVTLIAAMLLGMPIWLAVVLGILTLYRLHARFSVFDGDGQQEGHFLLVFILLFSVALVISLFNPQVENSEEIFAIAIAATGFYVCFRLLYRYIQTRKEGTSFSMLAVGTAIVIGSASLSGFLVYFLAEDARRLAGWVLGSVLKIVLWPFAGLMEKLTEYLSGLSTEQEMKETLEKLNPETLAEQEGQASFQPEAADFPVELMLAAILLVFFILLVFWLVKNKPEKEEQQEKGAAETQRYPTSSAEEPSEQLTRVQYAELDVEAVRKAYRAFEQQADAAGLGRKEYETVREWMNRMSWTVSESFFKTYDLVRYGSRTLTELEGEPFLEEIKKIKEKYLKEYV